MARRLGHNINMTDLHKVRNQNYIATKQIDKLMKDITSKHISSDIGKTLILKQTFTVYDSLNGKQDYALINKFLNICYNEIESPIVGDKFMEISYQILNVNKVSLTTMIRCCKALHIKQQYPSHLIEGIIDRIFKVAFQNRVSEEYDIKCLCSLMDIYGVIGNIDKAKVIFSKLADVNKLDVAMLGSMMKCLLNNNQNDDAIELYQKYHKTLNDNVIKVLYIKACANTDKALTNSTFDTLSNIEKEINNYGIAFINNLMKVYQNNFQYDKVKHVYTSYKKPHNHISHLLFLDVYLSIHSNDMHHHDLGLRIINGFDTFFNNDGMHRHFFDLLEFYCESNKNKYRLNDEIFKICQRKNIVPIQYMLSKILDHTIDDMHHNKFNAILDHILKSPDNIWKFVDDVVFGAILNGIVKTGQASLFNDIWNKVCIQCNIGLNIECYRYALLALSLSNSNNQSLLSEIIKNIKDIYLKCDDIPLSRKATLCHHILTAYSNLKEYDKMWIEYDEMKHKYNINSNLITLSILSSVNEKEFIIKSMYEIKDYLANNDIENDDNIKDNVSTLIGFYRKAEYVNDAELINILKPICNKHWLPPENHEYVLASIEYQDEKVSFENCYKNEKSLNLDLLRLIDQLIIEIGHDDQCTMQHKKPYNLLEYHAEKIAAAFLLNKDENIENIEIDVNLRMCNDCHLFFAKLSEFYPQKNIAITDPKTTHLFANGSCSCGKSRYL